MSQIYPFAVGRIHEGEIFIVPCNDTRTYSDEPCTNALTDEQWRAALLDAIDGDPGGRCEDAFWMGITDRDLGMKTRLDPYSTPDERAAYLAGKCAAQDKYGSGLSLEAIQAQLQELIDCMEDESFWRTGAW